MPIRRLNIGLYHANLADPNHVNDDDHALWLTCVHGDPDLVSLLIAHSANLDKETSGGYTALESAAPLPVLKYLRAWVAEHPILAQA